MPTQKEILRARVRAFKSTLQNASTEAKGGHAGVALAKNFNAILSDVGAKYETLKDHLPEDIPLDGVFAMAGSTDVSYLDLEILVDQVLSLLDLVEQ